jgi:hypothetical protein
MITLDSPMFPFETLKFMMLFERTAGAFVSNTVFHDCCAFLTSGIGQETFTPVTVSDSLEVVSTSLDDTLLGIGARSVNMIYLDSSGVWAETSVNLNGILPVALTGIQAKAIISMSVSASGSAGLSLGTINLRKVGTPSLIYEQIPASINGDGNQSKSGRFTVPIGYYLLINSGTLSVQNHPIEIRISTTRNQFDGSNLSVYQARSSIKLATGDSIIFPMNKMRLDAGQKIKVSALADSIANNSRVHGSLDMELIKI